MKTRIISACIMLPLLVLVYLGGWFIWAAALIVGLMGVREFYKGFEAAGFKPSHAIAYVSIAALYCLSFIGEAQQQSLHLITAWIAVVVCASMVYGFRVNERKLEDMTATLMGIMYVGFLSYHIVLIDRSDSPLLIWLVFLSAFGTDIMAYFTGMALGRHKLCPNLSPKKSVEGAVGGVLGSVIFCAIFGWLVMPQQLTECLIIGVLGSVAAQLGDLSASAFKRQMGIKDYGHLIPGHGGILDRFDSVMFTAPLVYYTIAFSAMLA